MINKYLLAKLLKYIKNSKKKCGNLISHNRL